MIRQLDWSTPLRRANLLVHWRVFLWVVLASIAGSMVWRAAFPHVPGFTILWSGG